MNKKLLEKDSELKEAQKKLTEALEWLWCRNCSINSGEMTIDIDPDSGGRPAKNG